MVACFYTTPMIKNYNFSTGKPSWSLIWVIFMHRLIIPWTIFLVQTACSYAIVAAIVIGACSVSTIKGCMLPCHPIMEMHSCQHDTLPNITCREKDHWVTNSRSPMIQWRIQIRFVTYYKKYQPISYMSTSLSSWQAGGGES